MKTIGLIGGVASGKSLVAKMLVELGAVRFDADAAVHELLDHDATVRTELLLRWGENIFNGDGTLDRRAVARRVFANGEEAAADRAFLEGLVHPIVQKECESFAVVAASNGRPALVIDAPLLLEAGWGPMCNVVLMVDAPRETRLARARKRGWDEAQFDAREDAQWPIVKKRGAADVVIKNDGSEAELRQAVDDFWQRHVASAG